ncbi:hypothetical protein NP233_g2206 [Leucocoprinus birnbaumii]|uniref:Ribosomal protein mS38 C-terminal domain-containing protein n=1 Tax=Leucocoprinus birnbaumii TaxID=56174 RepID=A0AAD5VYT1_9AGAR|nr:hypothetical protein NP233_g2206 [Leucocoprinus birnbaumii]
MAQSTLRTLILNVHTPTSSFAILHSLNEEDLTALFDKLSKKIQTDYRGQRVGPGWLKYEYGDTTWDLDDDSDYTIFTWRQQQYQFDAPTSNTNGIDHVPTLAIGEPGPSKSPASSSAPVGPTPTLYLHNPTQPLPTPPSYRNPSYYAFHPAPVSKGSPAPSTTGKSSRKSTRKKREDDGKDGVPKLMKQFEKFHNENGVRTVMGSIGPVNNVRMLLKVGYRHVYISRKFAQKHGFIPKDAKPGNYGYGGLVNIGSWPITLVTSTTSPHGRVAPSILSTDRQSMSDGGMVEGDNLLRPPAKAGAVGLGIGGMGQGLLHGHGRKSPSPSYQSASNPAPSTMVHSSSRSSTGGSVHPPLTAANGTSGKRTPHDHQHHNDHPNESGRGPTVTNIQVYLAEEPHFDVVLGRSFFEKRQIKTSSIDPTDVVCLDTGEKIECELVILKDAGPELRRLIRPGALDSTNSRARIRGADMAVSALARILPRIPATRRPYSSSFGGGRFFNSSKPPKSPVVTAKSRSDRSEGSSKDSSTKAAAGKTAQGSSSQAAAPNSAKPPTADAASPEPGHESATGRQPFRNGSAVSTPTPSPTSPSTTASAFLSGYTAPNAYHNYLSPHPSVNSKDFKIHQFFSLHRPLLLISNPPSIFQSPPADTPLFRSSNAEAKNVEDQLPPSPFTNLNLDGTYAGAAAGVDGDAETARQLHHSMTMTRVGATVDWEDTLRALGIDVSKDVERVRLQEQWDREWEEVMMDSTKRKKKKKMKKHKLKKRRRLTRASRLRLR